MSAPLEKNKQNINGGLNCVSFNLLCISPSQTRKYPYGIIEIIH